MIKLNSSFPKTLNYPRNVYVARELIALNITLKHLPEEFISIVYSRPVPAFSTTRIQALPIHGVFDNLARLNPKNDLHS